MFQYFLMDFVMVPSERRIGVLGVITNTPFQIFCVRSTFAKAIPARARPSLSTYVQFSSSTLLVSQLRNTLFLIWFHIFSARLRHLCGCSANGYIDPHIAGARIRSP